jgi:hypothetical protein
MAKSLPKINKNEFVEYIKAREHGADILFLLGFGDENAKPSEYLTSIITRKRRPKKIVIKQSKIPHFNKAEYEQFINLPIKNRKDAIVVLAAIFRCSSIAQIIGINRGDVDYETEIIYFKHTIDFTAHKEKWKRDAKMPIIPKIVDSSRNGSCKLCPKAIEILKALEKDIDNCKTAYGIKYNHNLDGVFCIHENGELIYPGEIKRHITSICVELNLPIIKFNGLCISGLDN